MASAKRAAAEKASAAASYVSGFLGWSSGAQTQAQPEGENEEGKDDEITEKAPATTSGQDNG